jgi:K+-sensing histidine kinase KdpD
MNTNGVGLGLAISKMISEEFGGAVHLISREDFGSIFQSSFVLKKPQFEALPNTQEKIVNALSPNGNYEQQIQEFEKKLTANCKENYLLLRD